LTQREADFKAFPGQATKAAIWWMEHVMRNPSAPQYDPPSWLAANSYDVILTLLIAVHNFIFTVFIIAKFMKNHISFN
jgi:hypothetical protein